MIKQVEQLAEDIHGVLEQLLAIYLLAYDVPSAGELVMAIPN